MLAINYRLWRICNPLFSSFCDLSHPIFFSLSAFALFLYLFVFRLCSFLYYLILFSCQNILVVYVVLEMLWWSSTLIFFFCFFWFFVPSFLSLFAFVLFICYLIYFSVKTCYYRGFIRSALLHLYPYLKPSFFVFFWFFIPIFFTLPLFFFSLSLLFLFYILVSKYVAVN